MVGAGADYDTLLNKAIAAESFTSLLVETGLDWDLALSSEVAAIIASVDGSSDMDAIDDAIGDVVDGGGSGGDFTLTVNADHLVGDADDNVFTAPVLQNEEGSGQLANTFETGDVLDGGAGRNILRADLIDTGTIQDGNFSAPISATTTNIQEVYFRAQVGNQQNDIDAEKMSGVEQWWSDNSRSTIVIEDIRSLPANTAFGMRETDPGVSFINYFNARYLEGDLDSESALTLTIQEITDGQAPAATELANITVREINFSFNDVEYTLDTEAMRAADTWAALETAVAEAMAATEGLADLSVTHLGNGVFVIEDAEGGIFEIADGEALILGNAAGIDVRNRADVGLVIEEGPTMTDVILDLAGNGSQGGTLNIGAMSGLRGIEVFDVSVDGDSHLTSMTSFNQTPGQYNALRNGDINEFLEVVNVTSIGDNGDLTVGRTDPNNIDGRVATWGDQDGDGTVDADRVAVNDFLGNSGFVNIKELNTAEFLGSLNVAITLDDNVIQRYLDSATEAVNFSYDGGAQNDIFNIADISALGVSADQDFAMQVDMGAGDDRLILNVPTVSAVSVDGGEGENSIVVAQSHGTNATNTFEAFTGFQTYEIEGNVAATEHDFTSMSGIENVIIATTDGVNTTLIDLEAAQNVTITGKNQTIGNNSTANQAFGIITLTDDAGTDRVVTLENTARLSNAATGAVAQDGILTVANLTINQGTGTSATRNVTVDSVGERNVANVVASFNGRDVRTLDLVGTQDLTFNVAEIGNQVLAANRTALDIDASELEGDLNLAITGAMIGNKPATLTDRIVGTEGDNDTLMLWGAQTTDAVTVTDFENIQFGSFAGTMYGDWLTAQTASGTFDAQNVDANHFVIADVLNANTLTLNNLGAGVTVDMGDANLDVNGAVVNSQALTEAVTLNSGAAVGTPAAALNVNYLSNLFSAAPADPDTTHILAVTGYQTINIDIAHAANLTGVNLALDDRDLDLTIDADARVLNFSGGLDHFSDTASYDVLTLVNALDNTITTIDFSDFVGQVNGVVLDAAAVAPTNTTIVLNGYATTITDNVTEQITTFRFTTDAVADTEDVIITGFRAFNDGATDLTDLSVLDFRDLGVEGLADITITEVGGNTIIESNDGLDFEITLVGVLNAELSNENFAFAV